MRRNKLVMAALLATTLVFGTARVQADVVDVLKGVLTYGKDRVYDTMDVFRLRVGMPRDGKGIGAKARVTSLAQVGFVTFDGKYFGLDRRGLGLVDERRREAGISVLYGSYNEMEPVVGNGFLRANDDWSAIQDRRILRNLPHWDDGRQRHLSIGAEAVLPIIAVDAGVYPEEILDLALGFVLVDIYDDDTLFGYNVKYREATTEPGPKLDGPFAEQRAKNAAFKKKMEEKKLAEEEAEKEAENAQRLSKSAAPMAEQSAEESAAPAMDTPPPPPSQEAPEKATNASKKDDKNLISDQAADQAAEKLNEEPAAVEEPQPAPPAEVTPTPHATPEPTPEPVVTEPPPTPEPEPTATQAPTPTPPPTEVPPPSPTAAPEPTTAEAAPTPAPPAKE